MSSPVEPPDDPFWNRTMSGDTSTPEWRTPQGDVSHESSHDVSHENSQPGSAGGRRQGKKRVGFGGGRGTDAAASDPIVVSWIDPLNGTASPKSNSDNVSPRTSGSNAAGHVRDDSVDLPSQNISKSHLPELSPSETRQIHQAFGHNPPTRRPRPAIRRGMSGPTDLPDEEIEGPEEVGGRAHRQLRMREAFERGKQWETTERSENNSRHNSPQRNGKRDASGMHKDNIELDDLGKKDDDDDEDSEDDGIVIPALKRAKSMAYREARRLVRKHTHVREHSDDEASHSGFRSGAVTPTEEQGFIEEYRPRPEEYRGGVFGALLKLYNQPQEGSVSHSRQSSMSKLFSGRAHSVDISEANTPQHSPGDSGTSTPTGGSSGKSRPERKNRYSASLAQLVGSSTSLGSPMVSRSNLAEPISQRMKESKEEAGRPGLGKKSHSSSAIAALSRVKHGQKLEDRKIRITNHIAEIMQRQKYLMLVCKALMQYGAPTHRLEEYMTSSARVLEIEAQFLYIPGSMIMSFDDQNTHTTEVKLVKATQGLDLGRLRDVHEIYKDVVHDQIGAEIGINRLKEVMGRKNKHSRWLRIPVYGLAAVSVGPFAFQARLIDLPIAFVLGCILGFLQLVVAPASDMYANVFEISAAVITSFLARAFGSIPYKGDRLFCFSALAQSSIALILPGYIVLCASLELQSKSIVAGSVRMVYAVIYSLFLGFGITIGTAIWGIIDKNATSATSCTDPISHYWFFFFVPVFTLCLIVINQAKWKQAPVMLVIAFTGYVVNYFSSQRFAGNTQVSNTLGALAIGVMANTYSRIGSRAENWLLDRWENDLRPYWKKFRRYVFLTQGNTKSTKRLEEGTAGDDESVFVRSTRRVGYSLAAAAMLPAIFVQVPSGLAVQGSLVSGIASANQIAGNATNGTQVVNSTTLLRTGSTSGLNSIAFNVSYSVIQVAIGITVGLFLSSLIVYPVGKRRSGLFSL